MIKTADGLETLIAYIPGGEVLTPTFEVGASSYADVLPGLRTTDPDCGLGQADFA